MRSIVPLLEKIAIFSLGVTALLNLYSTQPILSDLSRWAGINSAEAAWTVSAATIGVALTAPVAGILSDRLGRRRLILIAIVIMAIVTLLTSFSWNFYALLLFRFLQGICCPFIFAVSVSYISEEYSRSTSLKINSLYVAGTAFGGFLGRMLSAMIVDLSDSWRLSFAGNGVILMLIFLLVWCSLPSEKNLRPYSRENLRTKKASAVKRGSVFRLAFTVIIGATLLFQQVGSFTFMSLALTENPFYLSTSAVGLVFIVFLLPTIVTPWFGRMIPVLGQRYSFLITQVFSITGIILTLFPSIITVCIGLAMSCVGVFAGQSIGSSMASRLIPEYKSTSVGFYLTGYYSGGAIAGVVLGPIYMAEGWFGVSLFIMLVIAVGALFSWFAWNVKT